MEKKIVYPGNHVRLIACGHWEYAERTKASAGIVILAVTPENELLLTEQFRIPVEGNVIELPAGLAGDTDKFAGEEFEIAARRELLEETGYEAGHWEQLTNPGPPSAGLSNEMVVIFRATNLKKISSGGGEEHEKIQVHSVPLANLTHWLKQREDAGVLIDPKIYAGLYFLNHS